MQSLIHLWMIINLFEMIRWGKEWKKTNKMFAKVKPYQWHGSIISLSIPNELKLTGIFKNCIVLFDVMF